MSRLSRRQYLKLAATGAAGLCFKTRLSWARDEGPLLTGTIPSSGEQLPIIGLGSSATFRRLADAGETAAIQAVIQALLDGGGTVLDTAPSYGSAEAVAGQVVNQLGARERIFWATKLNVAGRGGGQADPEKAWAQIETSIARLGREPVDLIQVHNLADMPTQFKILQQLKAAERVRYIGVTSTFKPQYEALETVLGKEPLDFVGIDYAVDNRDAEDRLLPIARERGIAVMVYLPFGRTRLWQRVAGRAVPEWAAEFGARSWGQFFLKFAASHPAVTVVTPATSKVTHMVDNLGAAHGRLPDAAERRRMITYVDALPA
jgi:aryl-alcohol dehydrogenase-like predicted oxidoreductase